MRKFFSSEYMVLKAEGNWGWRSYRVESEEGFRITVFGKILLSQMGVFAALLGTFGRVLLYTPSGVIALLL
jgi:hypothetical protein